MTMAMTMAVMTLSMTRTQMDLVQSCFIQVRDYRLQSMTCTDGYWEASEVLLLLTVDGAAVLSC